MTKPRTLEEIREWLGEQACRCLEQDEPWFRSDCDVCVLAALREAADAAHEAGLKLGTTLQAEAIEQALREEREALRKRHIFGDEESGQAVYVEWRGRRYGKGPVLWAVTRLNSCLNKSGEWEYEPQPSSRDDAFIARCRWTSLDEALAAARSRAEEPKPEKP